jgi:hypothetical protein
VVAVGRYSALNSSTKEAPMAGTEQTARTTRHIYLLSLWREGRSWRAALRPADGGPRQGFGDLEQLAAFLLRLQDEPGLAAPEGLPPEGGKTDHKGA